MCERHDALVEVIKELEQINAELQEKIEACERDLMVQRLQMGKLRAAREREAGEGVEAQKVLDVIEYWRAATGHEKAKVSAAGARGDAVRKALRLGHEVEEIKEAIDGAARFPFVVNKARAQAGTEKQRYDDLPTVLRDEVQIQRMRQLAKRNEIAPGANEQGSFSTAEAWRALHYPLARVMASLWDINAEIDASETDVWRTSCPVHYGPGLVARRNPAGLMSIECERGCEFWRLLAALGLEPSDLFENAEKDPAREEADRPREIPAHLKEAAGLLMARLSGVAGPPGRV